MGTLQVREVPQDVYDALSQRARRERRSLAQQVIVELRRMPELEARERRIRTVAALRAALGESRRKLRPAPEALVREDRGR